MLNWVKTISTSLAAGILAVGMLAASADDGSARRKVPVIKHHKPGHGGFHHRPGRPGGGDFHRPGGGHCRHHCGGNHFGNGWDRPRYGYGVGLATGLVIGSVVSSVPSSCVIAVYGGVTYRNCSNVWYVQRYRNSGVVYVVVGRPY